MEFKIINLSHTERLPAYNFDTIIPVVIVETNILNRQMYRDADPMLICRATITGTSGPISFFLPIIKQERY